MTGVQTCALPIWIIGHGACLERFDTDVLATLLEQQGEHPGRWDGIQLIRPTQTFAREYRLDGDGMTLYHLPGHTQDSIVVFLEKQGVLFMGDTVETPFPCLEKGVPLSRWIAGLERWERDPRVQTVIPAHGDMGGKEIIRQNIAYLQVLADGEVPDVFEPLTDFYRDTHGANIGFAREIFTPGKPRC